MTDISGGTGPTGPFPPVITVTGVTGPTTSLLPVVINATGPTGPIPLFPLPTGPTGPTYLLTLDQLMTNQTATLQQETNDRTELSAIVTPNMGQLNPLFVQWATLGFPSNYTLLSFNIVPPTTCSDGTTRNMYDYISYIIGKDLGDSVTKFDGFFQGMTIAYNITGSTLTIVVSKSS